MSNYMFGYGEAFQFLNTREAAWYIISVLSVCLSDNFRKRGRRKFIFAQGVIRVKFVYEGHQVKVKVTGAEKVQNPYSRNVKLRSEITPVL